MKVDFHSAGRHAASLAWVAVRSFLGTVAVFTLAGCVLAAVSYYFLRERPVYAGIAAAVAIIEGIVTGVVLGMKRGAVLSLAHGLGRLRLGRSLIRLVFDRILKVTADEAMGERGVPVTRKIERLPLAQADELLTKAVHGVTGEAERGGWLRRKIQSRLLDMVRKYTLARFREEGAAHGGVDLQKVRGELEETVDDKLVDKVRGGLKLWTILTIIGLPFIVAIQTYIAIHFLHAK